MIRKLTCVSLCIALLLACALSSSAETLFDRIAEEEAASETSDSTVIINSGVNVMRTDMALESMIDGVYCVFGRDVARAEIEEIRFINNLDEMGLYAWDISQLQNQTVYAWVADSTLVIAAEGTVIAPQSCEYLFAFYKNLKKIEFNGNFDTSNTTDMMGMFAGCESLREIDLNTLDVSNVTSMVSMFENCISLDTVHASEWQLNSQLDSTNIFNNCKSLTYDTIDGIMTEKYEAMEAEAAKTYRPIQVGEYNDDVVNMQKRLKALGYAITKADGIYGKRTAAAVHAFKADHGIFDGTKHDETECTASALMLQALYETEIPELDSESESETKEAAAADLTVSADSEITSEELADNQLKLSVTLTSTSSQPITAYTLSVYTTDSDGAQLSDPVSIDFEQDIEPGAQVYSGDIVLDNRGKIANVHIGVEKITYKDGTDFSVPEIEYTGFSAVDWLE